MRDKPVLIVDDEANIRLTLSRTLEDIGLTAETAVDGEEALKALREKGFELVFLDLRLPGIDGFEVLRQAKALRPGLRVIVMTAYASVESAVNAMKLGAADFIQKPFTPRKIREIVQGVSEREQLAEQAANDYNYLLKMAVRFISEMSFDLAEQYIKMAIVDSPSRPEAYNLFGTLLERRGMRLEAVRFYRAALDIDPNYEQALTNLEKAIYPGQNVR